MSRGVVYDISHTESGLLVCIVRPCATAISAMGKVASAHISFNILFIIIDFYLLFVIFRIFEKEKSELFTSHFPLLHLHIQGLSIH